VTIAPTPGATPHPTPTGSGSGDSLFNGYWGTVFDIAAFGAVAVVCLIVSAGVIVGLWLVLRRLTQHPAMTRLSRPRQSAPAAQSSPGTAPTGAGSSADAGPSADASSSGATSTPSSADAG